MIYLLFIMNMIKYRQSWDDYIKKVIKLELQFQLTGSS